jgi:hypothetical protein
MELVSGSVNPVQVAAFFFYNGKDVGVKQCATCFKEGWLSEFVGK